MTAEQLLDSLFAAISARDLDGVAELYHAEMRPGTTSRVGPSTVREASGSCARS